MTPTLGTFERHADGVFSGLFRSLMIRAQIEIRPSPPSGGLRAYAIIAGAEFQLGVGVQDETTPMGPILLVLRTPEFAQEVHAQLVLLQGDTWSMSWHGA